MQTRLRIVRRGNWKRIGISRTFQFLKSKSPKKSYYSPGIDGLQFSFNEQFEVVSQLITHINELRNSNPEVHSNSFYSYSNFVPNLINVVIALVCALDENMRGEHVSRLLETFKDYPYEYDFSANTFK